jgi:murein DD-endopeptidase MepM/ murein hydrolase activator NlpD
MAAESQAVEPDLDQPEESGNAHTPVPDLDDHFDVHFDPADIAVPEPDSADSDQLGGPFPTTIRAFAAVAPSEGQFPGVGAFRMGQRDPAVTELGRMLIRRGGKRFYQVGPGPQFGTADRDACAAFQRAQGWTDANADGYPGPRTWALLVSGQGRDIPAGTDKVTSPVPGYRLSYAFGEKNHRYACGWHTGDDYAAKTGTPIVAVVSGTVIRTDWGKAYGNWTQIRGDDGHVWVYCHQSRRAVKKGQRVKAGQVIGYVGATGNVTGPHLHLEKSKGSAWSYAKVVKPRW